LVSSEALGFEPPPKSDPKDNGEEEELSSEADGLVVEVFELELGDETWVGVMDVVVSLLEEEELTMADELVEEAADGNDEDVVTGVVVEVSDEGVLECLLRALCKTSPRSRGLTASLADFLT
jgi:hypothetical protein